jgi:hypothetical protein
MTYATPEDVAVALRGSTSVTDAESVQWQAWLNRVERSIAAAFRRAGLNLIQQIGLDAPPADEVADVEVAAVIRKIDNPKWGRTSQTRSVDDGSITYRNEGLTANADPLALLPAEIADLLPASSATAFSSRPAFQSDRIRDPQEWL